MKKFLLFAFAAATVLTVNAATPEFFLKDGDTFKPIADGYVITVGYEEIEEGWYQWDSHLYAQADPELEVTCKFMSDASEKGAMMQMCGFDGQCVLGNANWTEKHGVIDSETPESMEVHVEYMDFTGAGVPTFETESAIQLFYDATPDEVITVYLRTMPQDVAGISTVSVDNNAPAVYYNLQGVKVANPVQGNLYIKQQGNKAVKVIF